MLIVDAQVHVWAGDSPERPWPKSSPVEPHKSVPFGPRELLREMDSARVGRAVLVPPIWEGPRNDLAIAAARAHPNRLAVMAHLDPMAPGARHTLRDLADERCVYGLRFTFQRPEPVRMLLEGYMEWVWGQAERAGLRICVLVPPVLVRMIDNIAGRYPGLKMVIDHMALPTGKKDAEAFRDFDEVLAIAKRPNVAAKASGLPCYSTDTYPYRSLHGYIRRAYDAFGPQRLFWGTDLSRSPLTYYRNTTLFTDELPWLTEEDKEWIMGRGVCEWIDWL